LKVLCEYTPSGPHYVRTGWGHVFQAAGHDFRFWLPDRKSAFDVFNEFQPDLFIGTTYGVDRAMVKILFARPQMKVAMFGSAWGPYLDDVDLKKYPLVVASDEEKNVLETLSHQIQKPDLVFIHAHDRWLEGTMSGWGGIGLRYAGILNAADTFTYGGPPVPRPDLACDIGFVGGYWGYKARNIDKFLLPLCHPDKGFNVKIFGNKPWPVHQYLGTIGDFASRDLFAAAKVCPNVSEPHSTDLGWDVIERIFKVPVAGGLVISDYVEEARDLFNDLMLPMAKTPAEFEALVRDCVECSDGAHYKMVRDAMKKEVLTKHTYFERVADIFEGIGLPAEAEGVRQTKCKVLNSTESAK
jgi:hypothetical protein